MSRPAVQLKGNAKMDDPYAKNRAQDYIIGLLVILVIGMIYGFH